MKLTDDQIAKVKEWAAAGESLSGIQGRLKDECGVSLTYLDTRLLIGDLGLELEEWKAKAREEKPAKDQKSPEKILEEAKRAGEGGGGFSLTVDKVTRPGAIVSGRATFSDGERAGWLVDSMGRLGFEPNTPGYRPSDEDMRSFQASLDKELRRMGM